MNILFITKIILHNGLEYYIKTAAFDMTIERRNFHRNFDSLP